MDIVDVACKDHGDVFDIGDDLWSWVYRGIAEAGVAFIFIWISKPFAETIVRTQNQMQEVKKKFDEECDGLKWKKWIPGLGVNELCKQWKNMENELDYQINNQIKLVFTAILSLLTGVNVADGKNYADKLKNLLNKREMYVCMLAKAVKATVEKFTSCTRETIDPKKLRLKM